MKETEIRRYAALMRELELSAIEVRENDRSVRLERSPVQESVPAAAPADMQPETAVDTTAEAGYVSVRSPMVGIFYAASAEDSEPFVSVGDTVKKGDTLCIIEAMKLMNELAAECDGVIQEICVSNGQVVDYGCELFRIGRQQK